MLSTALIEPLLQLSYTELQNAARVTKANLVFPNKNLDDATKKKEIVIKLINDKNFTDFVQKCFNNDDWEKYFLIKGLSLFPHQKQAIEFMKMCEFRNVSGVKGGMLHLQMGLGKTLICLYYVFLTRKLQDFPTLVVVSKTLLFEWQKHANKFLRPELQRRIFYLYKGVSDVDSLTRNSLSNYDIVITTSDVCRDTCKLRGYERVNHNYTNFGQEGIIQYKVNTKTKEIIVRQGKKIVESVSKQSENVNDPTLIGYDLIYGTPWARVICDESQNYANNKSQTFIALMAISAKYSWCLSGTPIKNVDTDLWAQFRFLGYTGKEKDWSLGVYNNYLKNNVLSLGYDDTTVQLPPRNDFMVYCDFSPEEGYLYNREYKHLANLIDGKFDQAFVLKAILRLRQICVCPTIMAKDSLKEDVFGVECAKMKKMVELAEEILERKEMVVVFSSFKSAIYVAKEALKRKNIPCYVITGDVDIGTRKSLVDSFQQRKKSVLLMNYKIGSEGLTLTEANNCIFLEPWWADYVHRQAYARVWRISQVRECNVYYLYVKDTIEEYILNLGDRKNMVTNAFFSGSVKVGEPRGVATLEEIRKFLQNFKELNDEGVNDEVKRGIIHFIKHDDDNVVEEDFL